MLSATECAPKRLGRLGRLALVLIACASHSGCARLATFGRTKPAPPLLGVASRSGGYADSQGPVLAHSDPKPRAESDRSPESPSVVAIRQTASRRVDPIEVVLDPPRNTPFVAPKPPSVPATRPTPTVESLLAASRAELATIQTYRVHMIRQERIGDTLQPAEEVILSLRCDPKAVRLEWPDGPHQGREVLYEDGGLLHINDPRGLVPRINLAPESPLVLRNSRHPIGEAGFEAILTHLAEEIRAEKDGDPGAGHLTYEGLETPGGYPSPCHKIARASMRGEARTLFLDEKTLLPALAMIRAPDGSLLESYLFKDVAINPEELATASAFDPGTRWGPPQGLLSRIARRPKTEGRSMPR